MFVTQEKTGLQLERYPESWQKRSSWNQMSSKMVPQAPKFFLEFQVKDDWAKSSETYLLHFDTHVAYFILHFLRP